MAFKKAEKSQSKLRLALSGPSGSGKTYSALAIATHLGSKVAVIDTERGSASKYASRFSFDVEELQSFHPDLFVAAIHEAESAGYDVIVVDSLSHAWAGKGGILEIVDGAAKKASGARDSFSAWKMATPIQNRLFDTIVQARAHIICTMRSKTEWVLTENERGKMSPKKIGTAPIQRDGAEFEFDVVGEMNVENEMVISKSRCELLSAQVIAKPGADVARTLLGWLNDGTPVPTTSAPPPAQSVQHPTTAKPPEHPVIVKLKAARTEAERLALKVEVEALEGATKTQALQVNAMVKARLQGAQKAS